MFARILRRLAALAVVPAIVLAARHAAPAPRAASASVVAPSPLGNAAYRDGRYQARLGNTNDTGLGRWARSDDRANFALGYTAAR